MKRLDRRSFLTAAGGAMLSVPFFESLRCGSDDRPSKTEARSFAINTGPKRLVVLWTPLGTLANAWYPPASATETSFTLGPILAPLAPFQSDIIVTRGIDDTVAATGPSDGHGR